MPAVIRENQVDQLMQRLEGYLKAREGVLPGNVDDPEELQLLTKHRVEKAKLQLSNMGIQIEQGLEPDAQ